MTTKVIISLGVMTFIFGGIVAHYSIAPDIEYIKEYVPAPTIDEIIDQRITDIIASEEFQNEVNAMARARALYALSIEKQDIAVELSDQAMQSYLVSKQLAEVWTNSTIKND